MEPFRRDADDRVLNTVQILYPADNVRIGIVAISPGSIGDYCDGMRIAASRFFGAESATENWLHTECVEIISRYNPNGCAFGPVADAQRSAGDAIDNERLKQRGVFFEINEVRIREPVVPWYAARRANKREHPVLMWHKRIRPNQNSFNPTEHRGVCPNAKGEAKHRKNGKSGTAQEHSETEPKILKKCLHQFVTQHEELRPDSTASRCARAR